MGETVEHHEVEACKAEGPPNISFHWLRHPLGWVRWRNEVRRKGPYAPDFNEWLHLRAADREARRSGGAWPK